MDRVKRAKKTPRSGITRLYNELEIELAAENPNVVDMQVKMRRMEEYMSTLADLDRELEGLMLDNADTPEEDFEAEILVNEGYSSKVHAMSIRIEEKIPQARPPSPARSVASFATAHDGKKSFKLPKIELKQFNGDRTEWLGWWSQFEKIHADADLHATDKFQYLIQATTPGTRARKLVESYPQTELNYPKIIDTLKDRFGDKILLTEVYVRKLINLVITNVGKAKDESTLASMYDELESNLRALESLGVTADQSAAFLYPMVESSLPKDLVQVWQRSPLSGYDGEDDKATDERLKSLMKFLKIEVKGAERLSYVQNGLDSPSRHNNSNSPYKKQQQYSNRQQQKSEVSTAAGLFSSQASSCIFCDKSHASQECGKAHNISLQNKREKIREMKACFQCLKVGHSQDHCKNFVRCPVCTKRHYTIICPELPIHMKPRTTDLYKPSHDSKKPGTSHANHGMSNRNCTREVLLSTLLVRVIGPCENKIVRLLFDNGSQRSYIRRDTAKTLNYQPIGEEWMRKSLHGGIITDSKKYEQFHLILESIDGSQRKKIEAIDELSICGRIGRIPRGSWMKELEEKDIQVSDIRSTSPEIEILIGSDYYGQCLTGRIVQLHCGLTAFETIFGWTLTGRFLSPSNEPQAAMTVISMLTNVENSIKDLWNIEALGISDSAEHKSQQEKDSAAKKHFMDTVARTEDGRYTVSLPWVNGKQAIPSNRFVAEKRLLNATAKLNAAGKFEVYDQVFKSWEAEGIIEEFCENDEHSICHYLPHRPVFKPDSQTTPVRPVFDASCKMGRHPSLNDCLEKGPNLLEEIPSLLLRFREKKIGVISDIRKAFLMVEVKQEDRDFLRFLWWEDASCKSIKVYKHKRVVFGVTCSPFLLGAVIEHHISQVPVADKPIADKLLRSIYVDNCVTSVESDEEYQRFKSTATKMMADAKMDLRQWECSSGWESGVGPLPLGCGLDSNRTDTLLKMANVLGLKWNKEEDSLYCDFQEVPVHEKVTKRRILSFAQKIFDPIGFLAPALLCPKMILQEAWATKTGWDQELSADITNRFGKWSQDVNLIQKIRIPRNSGQVSREHNNFQIHVFCDASKFAFATAIFLRTTNNGKVTVQLLLAKARVAPLKKITIPRLELLSCLIGSRLATFAKKGMDMEDATSFYWSDSSTALAWIRRNDEWGTFVGNRVREINLLSAPQDWRHVPGRFNPADLPSRGCGFAELLHSKWWEGPDWLKNPQQDWPVEETALDEDAIEAEKKKSPVPHMLSITDEPWYCKRFSNYLTNLRMMAWIIRFLRKSKKLSREAGSLTPTEIREAEIKLFTIVQKESFPLDEDVICGLRVAKDRSNLIHVKTKLINRPDSDEFRYPVLLPNKHPLVDQLIRHEHSVSGHAGVQILMSQIREKCWIVQGRKAIKNIVRRCAICRRFSTKSPVVPEAPLPANRVKTARVFEITGVDLAGPLYLKDKTKNWFVLFTCAVYRCVHLELVDALSTDAFIMALSRFISRRGRPSVIYSDNGTNFHGADNIFRSLDWRRISRERTTIQWIFNPPSAAWWGGWWERLIRSIKDLLKRMLGHQKLNYMQLYTKLCQVEAIINSRPLTYVTEDQDDLIPLTPAMFLQETQDTRCPEAHVLDETGLRRKYRDMKIMTEEFQQRFRKEYLSQLIHRGKGKHGHNFHVNDVVLIGDDNHKRLDWPMARIVELIPGNDGVVRVAKLKTAAGSLTRPIQRLYPLEVSLIELPPITPEIVKKAAKKKQDTTPKLEEDGPNPPEAVVITRSGRKSRKPTRF